jgi:hypothetical protein
MFFQIFLICFMVSAIGIALLYTSKKQNIHYKRHKGRKASSCLLKLKEILWNKKELGENFQSDEGMKTMNSKGINRRQSEDIANG